MAQKPRDDRLKQGLLLGFVTLNLLLIALIWADGLQAGDETLPAYYRGAPGGEVDPTPTAGTRFPETTDEGSAAGEHDHQGNGHGAGRGRATATPLPESTEDLPLLPSLDGDDA